MHRLTVIVLCGLIGACSPSSDAINVCESELLKTLRSPSTYSRVEAAANPPWEQSKFWTVSLSYDADNAFGTPVRGTYLCAFKAKPDGTLPDKMALESAAMSSRVDAIEDQLTPGAEADQPVNLYPCCLSRADKKAFADSGFQ